MRIPTDVPLVAYIRRLIRENRIEEFYWTEDWKELRAEVMRENHYECVECMKRGKYVRADCVHHVNHVQKRPDLALSKFYTDQDGNEQKQLVPLCNACHNMAHPEKGFEKNREKFTNVEKW